MARLVSFKHKLDISLNL